MYERQLNRISKNRLFLIKFKSEKTRVDILQKRFNLKGLSLVITVDCSIEIRKKGMQFIKKTTEGGKTLSGTTITY